MLNLKQRNAIAIMVEGGFTYTGLSEKLKITRKTLYNWRQSDEFKTELKRKMRLRINGLAPKALRKMEKLVDSKNEMVAYMSSKDLLDRAGYSSANKVNIAGAVPVQIIDDI